MERAQSTRGDITTANAIGLMEVSIVLVAEDNDPSIINRDFLDRFEILVGEWEVVQADILDADVLTGHVLGRSLRGLSAQPW